MYNLPEKLKMFTPYEPLIGEYKIRLDVNESFIEMPHERLAQIVKNVKLNRYPDFYATAAVAAFSSLFGVNPARVTAGNGSDELIMIITSALLQKGDKVLCLKPDFPMYSFYSRLAELDIIELDKDKDMTVDADELTHQANTKNVKCIIFSNPCNPTSLGIGKSDVMRIIKNTSALVILDEAYMDFWDEKESLLEQAQEFDNLIVLRTCSKSVALAGIRLGFAITCERLTAVLRAVKSPYNVNTLSQAIGEAVLSDEIGYKRDIALMKTSIKHLYESVLRIDIFDKVYDTCTNFLFIKTEAAKDIYENLLTQSIAVRCLGNYLRICTGRKDENEALIHALQKYKQGG